MKHFIRLLCILLVLPMITTCFNGCGNTKETEKETQTPSPENHETETKEEIQSDTETEFEVPDDPTFDPNEDTESTGNVIFDYDFTALGRNELTTKKEFPLIYTGWTLTSGDDAYLENDGLNGYMTVKDEKLLLPGKTFMMEMDITFNELPKKEAGVTNFPLSLLTWVRKIPTSTLYDWIIKVDEQGYLYVKSTTKHTGVKIEAGKRYTIGVMFDEANSRVNAYLDGKLIGMGSFTARDLIESSLKFLDWGKEKGHFSARVHAVRAHFCDERSLFTDATRDIFAAMTDNPSAVGCFVGYTDEDALSYAVNEEMKFEIYLTYNGEVVSAPYFYYSVEGEDGQKMTEGYADGSTGHFTVRASMSKPGAVRVKAYACDKNKVKLTKNNSSLFVNLETTTPQKADLCFNGGAIAGFDDIVAGGEVPADLKEYWEAEFDDCYRGDINVLRFEELNPTSHGGTSAHHLYLVEIEAADGFVTGYLTVPKNASKLSIECGFVSYGNKKKPSPTYSSGKAVFRICAHSYHLDDPNAAAPNNYGFDNTENQDPDTVYFKKMFIRNIIAARFLKAYIGDSSYGKIVFGSQTISPLGKWKKGDTFSVTGGSQASFQSVALAAMDHDVTHATFGVPWFCDIGGDLVGRFSGWNPDYTDALMYYDCCSLATLIEKDVTATITAGLGDKTSEPSGVIAFYNALSCKVSLSMGQNRDHSYNPPIRKTYTVEK